MNALVQASAVISNAAYLLNLDCDNHINNSKALRKVMCFAIDPASGKKICYVQFPQRLDGIDRHDRCANRNTVFFELTKPPPTSTILFTHFKNQYERLWTGSKDPFTLELDVFLGDKRSMALMFQPRRKPQGKHAIVCLNCVAAVIPEKQVRKGSQKRTRRKSREALTKIPALECIEERVEGIENEKSYLMPQVNFEKNFGQSPVFVASTLQEEGGVPSRAISVSVLKESLHVISCGYEEKRSATMQALCSWPSLHINRCKHCVHGPLFISIAATSILEMQWGRMTPDDWWRNEQFWLISGVSSGVARNIHHWGHFKNKISDDSQLPMTFD